ncbi:mothers against decapentaplegic homolog 6 isoform X1 [Hyalella azteca]|uniref:Mothers against decapentaplegic homolog n=1 Tax=Hyalella azteca TaxID=294128 RepID=A0A8B7NYW4_HYAAZ|nr:mothers against decapentaplegic homolog 6 isoform X1 [Hyalella azteca]
MLGCRKKSLIRKAWRRRVKPPEAPRCLSQNTATAANCTAQQGNSTAFAVQIQSQNGIPSGPSLHTILGNQSALKTSALSILNQLKVSELESLNAALEAGGAGPCVLVPNRDVLVGGVAPLSPAFLSLAVWRWPDLPLDATLRPVPPCTPDLTQACINPYHSAICCATQSDSPPPPYRERPSPHDRLHPRSDEDDLTSSKFSQSSRYESQETGGRVPTSGWCSVRYWEKSTRVGAAFEVASDSVSVVGSSASLTVHSGLCLNLLSASLSNTSQEALKIKNKIGPGILICREDSEVWLYNQSNVDVFVSSPALPESIEDTSRFDSPSVRKIKPGHTLKIFSFDLVDSLSRISAKRSRLCGRVDVFCVNVSFCKGFGSSYKRREITACPCWLQLHLEPPR